MKRLTILTVALALLAVGAIGTVHALTLKTGNMPQYNNVDTPLTIGTSPNGRRINPQGPTLNPQKTEEYIQ